MQTVFQKNVLTEIFYIVCCITEKLSKKTTVVKREIDGRREKTKIWIEDIRPAPDRYVWCKSVNQAKRVFSKGYEIELIDIGHNAGDFVSDGGDYIRLLDWLEEVGYDGYIHIHSMNPVGVENMRRIIKRNGWREI